MSSKSKAMLPRDPLISSRMAFLRPVAKPGGLEGREGAAAEAGDEDRRVVDGDLATTGTCLGRQPVHRAREGPLAHEGLGDGADAGDPLPGDEVGEVDDVAPMSPSAPLPARSFWSAR